MNTKLIGIVAAVILLLGAGGLYFLNQNKSQTNTDKTVSPTETKSQASSLLDILNLGKNQRCTFTTTTDKNSTEGTFYIADKKMRGDIKTTANGKTEEISMIRDGDTNYMWGTSLKMGIKMKLNIEDLAKDSKTTGQFVDPNQKFDYKCMPWTTDNSLFTPPSNVKFTELPTSMMPKTTGTQTAPSNKGYLCDGITDPTTKAACVNSMNGY
jgi:hypothetical protein